MFKIVLLFLFLSFVPRSFAHRFCAAPLLGWDDFDKDLQHLKICDQGRYPFCSLFALKTFLDSWILFHHHFHDPRNEFILNVPNIKASYLGLGFNGLVGRGETGHYPRWLSYSLAKYGAIEAKSKPVHELPFRWPFLKWKKFHENELINPVHFELLANTKFSTREGPPLSPRENLYERLKFQPRDFRWVIDQNPFFPVFAKDVESPAIDPTLRIPLFSDAEKIIQAQASREQVNIDNSLLERKLLTQLVVTQLQKRLPVLITIIADMTKKEFEEYSYLPANDILPLQDKKIYPTHGLTALAICTRQDIENPLCKPFLRFIKDDESCVVLQNSYGRKHHHQGRLGISLSALSKILYGAWVHCSSFSDNPVCSLHGPFEKTTLFVSAYPN